MKIIVLGADGYLGWPTVMDLASAGHDVVAVDNYLKRKLEDETQSRPLLRMPRLDERRSALYSATKSQITVREGDCADFEFLDELFHEFRPDAVVHYAEQPSGPYSMIGYDEAKMTLENNTGSTLALIHAVLKHRPDCHIVKLGTAGEYGTPNIDIEEGWIEIEHNGRKDTLLFPRAAGSFYHTTKILDTDILWFYTRMKKLCVTDLMQGPVYGMFTDQTVLHEDLQTHFHYDDMFGTALNRFVVQAVLGIPMTVYGNGSQVRGYLDIRDTLQCIRLALETPVSPGTLRIMNQFTEQFSVLELANKTKQAALELGINAEIANIENPRIELEDHYYNMKNEKFKELGLKAHLLSNETIVKMIEFVAKHEGQLDPECVMPRVRW